MSRHATCPPFVYRAIAVLAVTLLTLAGCTKREAEARSGAGCIANSIGTLHLTPTIPSCAGDAELVCRAKCLFGDSSSCLGLAYELDKDPKQAEEALQCYRKACVGGAANACTNFAASIWAGHPTAAELTCARRTFEKACAANEPFACGMVGRVLLEATNPPPYARGRAYLESACDKVGGFPCRVLAKHLESGKLGSYKPEQIRALLTRACATGDADACGNPRTATETFH